MSKAFSHLYFLIKITLEPRSIFQSACVTENIWMRLIYFNAGFNFQVMSLENEIMKVLL